MHTLISRPSMLHYVLCICSCNDLLDCFSPDYCHQGGVDGFNCLPEMKCVPRVHVCDGVPDCVFVDTALEELECGMCEQLAL